MKRTAIMLAALTFAVPTATASAEPAPVVVVHNGSDAARAALRSQGATASEIAFAITVCMRESNCTIGAHNYNTRTRDDSWGPWQINYWGNMRGPRTTLIGPPATNTSSWERAARNFLKFLRAYGRCHWQGPNYCS